MQGATYFFTALSQYWRPQDWKWQGTPRYISQGLLVPDWSAGRVLDVPNVSE
jgi:hypothetical protein